MAPKPQAFLLLLLPLLLLSPITAIDILGILKPLGDYSTFTQYLIDANLVDEINSRDSVTVLAVKNSEISPISSLPADVRNNVMSVHVLLGYFDPYSISHLHDKTTLVPTLFQSTGFATNQNGYVKVTKKPLRQIIFGTGVPGSTLDSYLLSVVGSDSDNLSVLHISDPIIPPGIDSVKKAPAPVATSPTTSSPTKQATPEPVTTSPTTSSPTKQATPTPVTTSPTPSSPTKQATPAPVATPSTPSSPTKQATSAPVATPSTTSSPTKQATPAPVATPSTTSSPTKQATPAPVATPSTASSPTKQATPAPVATPSTASSPTKQATPAPVATPSTVSSPTKQVTSASAPAPVEQKAATAPANAPMTSSTPTGAPEANALTPSIENVPGVPASSPEEAGDSLTPPSSAGRVAVGAITGLAMGVVLLGAC